MRLRLSCALLLATIAACGDNIESGDNPDAGQADAAADATPADAAPPAAPVTVRVGAVAVTSFGFGSRLVGTTESATLTISTDSDAALTVDASLTDADAAFTLDAAASTCDDGPVAAGATCTVVLAFAPTTAGDKTATLRVSVDGHAPVELAITGRGGVAGDLILDFDPDDHGFGLVQVGENATATIEVTNQGTTAATITGAAIAGAGFTQVSTTCSGALAVDASCEVVARFTPTALGAATATLTITAGTETATTGLTGSGAGRITVVRTGAGTGTVTSLPLGIDCPTTCTGLFTAPVVLTATPTAGDRVVSWTAPCAAGPTCALTPGPTPVSVDVRFEAEASPARLLTIDVTGGGLGAVAVSLPSGGGDCTGLCTYPVAIGQTVSLRMDTVTTFTGWSGSCTGTDQTCNFVVDGDESVTATFAPNPRTVVSRLLPTLGPDHVAFTASGDLLITNRTTLTRLSATGEILATATLPVVASAQVIGLDSDAAGNVYVLRRITLALRLDKLDAAGAPIWNRAIAAASPRDLDHEPHLSVNAAGTAVVAAGLVRVYEPDGDVLWENLLLSARGAAIASDGRVFVAVPAVTPDMTFTNVVVFDAAGVGSTPVLSELEGYHVAMATGPADVLAIATSGFSRVTFTTVGGPTYTVRPAKAAGAVNAGVGILSDGDMVSIYDATDGPGGGFVLRVDSNVDGADWVLERAGSVGLSGAQAIAIAVGDGGRFALLGTLWTPSTTASYLEIYDDIP
jgi:uncharacterized repeat protein (TIGR02543 family)